MYRTAIALALLFAVACPLGAEDDRFGMWIEPAELVTPSGSAEAAVYLSSAVDMVQGWSLGVRAVDSTDYSVELKIVNAVMGTDLLTAGPGEGEPGFHSCSLLPADTPCGVPCPDCTGVTQGVVLDFMQQTFLDATDRFSPLKLFLDVQGTEGGEPARLEFTSDLGEPPVKTVIVLGGESLEPATLVGSEISVINCNPNFRPRVGDAQGSVGTERSVPIYLDFDHAGTADFRIQGWSLGVRHDSAVLELVDVTTDGTDTLVANDGGEPDFNQFKFEPAAPPAATEGFSHGVVMDFQAAVTLEPRNDFLDAFATYRLIAEPDCPQVLTTEVVPVGDLGQPVVRMVMVVGGESVLPCSSESGTVTITCTVDFIRGDSNGDERVDIGDGIFVFNFLFRGADPPACMDAADANDDGQVDSSDGIYIINYQFLGGAAPPPPFPALGLDPTEDDLPDC